VTIKSIAREELSSATDCRTHIHLSRHIPMSETVSVVVSHSLGRPRRLAASKRAFRAARVSSDR
jgi:hypothetical protein